MDKKEQLEKVYEQLPILSIEGIGIKELSEKFIDWYFQDDSSASIIKRIKDKALNEERAEWIDLIKKLKDIISNKEKHGKIILDAEVIDEEYIRTHLNPTPEEEKMINERSEKIKRASERISIINDLCYELRNEIDKILSLKINSPHNKGSKSQAEMSGDVDSVQLGKSSVFASYEDSRKGKLGCGKDFPTGLPPRIWDCHNTCGECGFICDDCKSKEVKK